MPTVHRCMIVPEAHVALARAVAAAVAGPAGAGMWSTGLSADGSAPATHWISTGMVDESFAALMPVTTHDEAGVATTQPGDTAAIVQMAATAGLTVTQADMQALLSASLITPYEPFDSMARAGLVLVLPAAE